MAAIGAPLFAVFLWGSMLGVLLVFAYECYVFALDSGIRLT